MFHKIFNTYRCTASAESSSSDAQCEHAIILQLEISNLNGISPYDIKNSAVLNTLMAATTKSAIDLVITESAPTWPSRYCLAIQDMYEPLTVSLLACAESAVIIGGITAAIDDETQEIESFIENEFVVYFNTDTDIDTDNLMVSVSVGQLSAIHLIC